MYKIAFKYVVNTNDKTQQRVHSNTHEKRQKSLPDLSPLSREGDRHWMKYASLPVYRKRFQ